MSDDFSDTVRWLRALEMRRASRPVKTSFLVDSGFRKLRQGNDRWQTPDGRVMTFTKAIELAIRGDSAGSQHPTYPWGA